MMFFLACYLLLPSLSILLHAQIPDTVWSHTYGGTNTDILYSACETSDGGCIAAGYTYSFGAGQQDAYLVKTYGNGDAAWARTFGGSSMDGAHFVREALDGGYMIAGYTESFGGGGKNVYLIKTDTLGYAELAVTYATPLMDVAYAFCTTPDSGYMFVGYKNGPSGWAKGDLWILKTDAWLDTAWTKEYGGAGEDYGISIQPTPDGGYIIAGSTMSFGAGGKDVWLVKIDADGDTSWTKTYGGVLEDVAYGVNVTADGGYIVSGYINGIGAWTAGDVWLLKTNSLGDTLWTAVYGASGEDYGFDVYQTPDNGYVTAGRGSNDFWLLRTDPQGDTLWTRKYGGGGTESALALSRTSDGGYVIGGYTTSFGSGLQDFWLIRTEPDVGIENDHSANVLPDRLPATIITGQLNLPTTGEFKVYDISGRIVEPSTMVKGIYFVKVDGNVTHKLVKIK